MSLPRGIIGFNTRYLNPLMLRFAGRGSMADLEHVGRVSGRTLHTPLMAFRSGDSVTIALTYGADVQWLKNIRAAGGCRMRLGASVLALGPPEPVGTEDALERIPNPQRSLLRWPIRCHDYVELPVLDG